MQNQRQLGTKGIFEGQSDSSVGWAIRRIESANAFSVTLNDGVSFASPCFVNAQPGDIWAVCHEAGLGCFGEVKQAVLLEPARQPITK